VKSASLASVLFLLGHLFRTTRWRITLSNEYRFSKLVTSLSASYIINLVIPLRGGDLYRFQANSKNKQDNYVLASSLIFERLLDLVTIPLPLGYIAMSSLNGNHGVPIQLFVLSALSILIFGISYSSPGQRFLISLRMPGAIEDSWLKLVEANVKISRRTKKSYQRYTTLTLFMWLFYLGAIHYLSLFLNLSVKETWDTLYSASLVAPFWLIKKLTSLDLALGYLSLVTIPLLVIYIVGRFSNFNFYISLRNREKQLSESLPMPSLLFSPPDMRVYMLDLLRKKDSLLEVAMHKLRTNHEYLKDLGGGSGASTYLVRSPQQSLMVLKMSNDSKTMTNLELQYHHMQRLNQNSAPIINLGKFHKFEDELIAYEMDYSEEFVDLSNFMSEMNVDEIEISLKKLIRNLQLSLYKKESPQNKFYAETLDFYYREKIGELFERLNPYFKAFSKDGIVIINGETYDLLTKHQFENWLSNFGQVGNACSEIHGDLTFQNMLINKNNFEIITLDSNGNHPIIHPSVDFGKIFQSLLLQYELIDSMESNVESIDNEITYNLPTSTVYRQLIEKLDIWLFQPEIVSEWENLGVLSRAQFGIHLLRLLPYKLKNSPDQFPLYYGELLRLINSNSDKT